MSFVDRLETISSKRTVLLLILALCVILRVSLAYYKGDVEVTDNDARIYMQIADNLLAGNGFAMGKNSYDVHPTAFVAPGYPVFLAAAFASFGDGLLDISLAQSVLDTCTCLIVFAITLVVGGGRRLPATLAALGYAVYPPFILSACTPMTETLTTAIFVLAVYVLVRVIHRSWAHAALAGASMGLVILIRPPFTLLPVVVAAVLWLRRRGEERSVAKAAAYVVAACLVLCPWVVRNYVVMNALLLTPTSGSQALWGGTGAADGYSLGTWSYPVDSKKLDLYDHPRIPDVSHKTYLKIKDLQAKAAGMDELERDRFLRNAAVSEIREDPGRFAYLGIKKVVRLWLNLWYDWPASLQSYALAGLNALFLLFGALGYRRSRICVEFKAIALGSCVYITLVSAISFAVVRYSYPLLPLVIVLAAGYLGSVSRELRGLAD